MTPQVIDLTLPAGECAAERRVALHLPEGEYSARVYDFTHHSMVGTYIDLPGHIVETDDGVTASDYPIERLFRIPALVLHLARPIHPGQVSAAELEAAARQAGAAPESRAEAVVVHALGARRFDAIPARSIYLAADAVEWLIALGIRVVVSDIYESNTNPQSVFRRFFQAGVATVCCPIDLHRLPSRVALSVLFCRMGSVTQLPCRIVAQTMEEG